MDWLIWVIVIVLVVAIIWWLMSRNKAPDSTATQARATTAPAAMEPGNRGTIPDTAAAAAGVAGLAGVTNLGTTAAEGSGPTREERAAEEPDLAGEPETAGEPEVEGEPETAGEPEVADVPRVTPEPEAHGAAPSSAIRRPPVHQTWSRVRHPASRWRNQSLTRLLWTSPR